MNPNDPLTWHDISSHPFFKDDVFSPDWYDGDVNADLRMLRSAATEVLSRYPQCVCELVVLDDCTMYFTVHTANTTFCAVYPAKTEDYRPCYFVDVKDSLEEIRVETIQEVLHQLDKFMARL